ncbi:MAG: TolC family protein [Bryobacterales bacterium]|nr:TolC family protein [Bryobacterales bacterium]
MPSSVREGPSGTGGAGQATGISGTVSSDSNALQNQVLGLASGTSVALAGPQTTASGPAVPLLDPALVGTLGWNRTNRPQTNTFITGTNQITQSGFTGDLGVQKGFLFGGQASLGLDAARQNTNNLRSDINPATTGGLALTYVQPLLRGFGRAVNDRYIRIANNNRQVSDLVFEQQVISTAFAVTRLYWDLVSLRGQVAVQRQTLELSERLLKENIQKEEAGVVAPMDVVRSRAEVARSRRDLTVAETNARQQETVLKDYLSRGVIDSPRLMTVRVVPTDTITPPAQDPVTPLQDMVATARKRRPEVAQAGLQAENARIALQGSRNGLLPQLNLVVNGRTNALVGSVSTLPTTVPGSGGGITVRNPDPSFIGGLGTGLGQVFGARFPDYGAELQLSIPIWNRVARADYARDQLAVRQQEIRGIQLEKQMRVEIVNAQIAVEQSRAAWEAAQEARSFQELSLEAEQERYRVGVSTNYTVIQYQRDLAAAQQLEVAALADYAQGECGVAAGVGGFVG